MRISVWSSDVCASDLLVSPDGATIALEPFQAVRISGDEPLSGCLRRGPVRDLNVMVRRKQFAAEMEIWSGPRGTESQVGSGDCLLVHSLSGRCAVRVDDGEPQDLAPGETLVHEGCHEGRHEGQTGRHNVRTPVPNAHPV